MPPTEPSSGADTVPVTELLSTTSVIPYLVELGVVAATATAVELEGGVSNVVLRVVDGDEVLIVKQSLPRLRVVEEWLAPQERIVTEAEAMTLASTLVVDGVPEVVLSDDSAFVLAMTSAPAAWTDWKTQLMAGVVHETVASRVGDIIGHLHRSTLDEGTLSPLLRETEPFEQLRLRPYYEHTANAVPAWSGVLAELADELRANRRCLVHGDLSPKNILAPAETGERAWVIDFEVSHRGDPRFDLAFLLTHLTLKSIHLPASHTALDSAARAFLNAYAGAVGNVLPLDLPGTARQVGALLLARVHGKSPAEYLTAPGRAHVERLAAIALEGRIETLDNLTQFREDTRS